MGKPPNIDVNVKEQARIKQQEKYEKNITRKQKVQFIHKQAHTAHKQSESSKHTYYTKEKTAIMIKKG